MSDSSDASDDDELMPPYRMGAARNYSPEKMVRLRRIFLNKPTGKKKSNTKHEELSEQPRLWNESAAAGLKRGSQHIMEPFLSRTVASKLSQYGLRPSQKNQDQDEEEEEAPKGAFKKMDISIEQHERTLAAKANELYAHQRDKLERTQLVLARILEELHVAKHQEDRALENRVNELKEKFSSRVEAMEQDLLKRVDKLQDELNAAIRTEIAKCEGAIQYTTSRLTDRMEKAIVAELSVVEEDSLSMLHDHEGRWEKTAISWPPEALTSLQPPIRHVQDDRSENEGLVVPRMENTRQLANLSPLSKTRKKIERLEEKLAALPAHKLRHSMALNHSSWNSSQAKRSSLQAKWPHGSKQESFVAAQRDDPSPWQTLSKNETNEEGRHGISFASPEEKQFRKKIDEFQKRERKNSGLNHRYLRPEEEQEFVKLTTRMGLVVE